MQQRKVLFVTTYDAEAETFGGASWVDRSLIDGLSAAGAAVEIVPVTGPSSNGAPAVPLEVSGHPRRVTSTLSRMARLREPYQAAKFRWAPGWHSRGAEVRARTREVGVVVTSQTPALLLCADSGVAPDFHVAHNVDAVLARVHDPMPFRLMRNASRTERLEQQLMRVPRHVMTLSKTDAQRIRDWSIEATPVSLCRDFTPRRRSAPRGRRLGFIGKASWPPNRQALQVLVHEVLPALRAQFEEDPPELVIAGRGSEEYAGRPGVVALGVVDSIDDFYAAIDLVVVPRTGQTTGISVKLLEALAQGVPVVAPAALATDAGVRYGVIVAETAQETIDAVAQAFVTAEGLDAPVAHGGEDLFEGLDVARFAQRVLER